MERSGTEQQRPQLVRSPQVPVDDSPTNYVVLYDYTLFSIVPQVLCAVIPLAMSTSTSRSLQMICSGVKIFLGIDFAPLPGFVAKDTQQIMVLTNTSITY